MKYLLIVVFLTTPSQEVTLKTEYPTMLECFDAREQVVDFIGRPIVNYQSICVQKALRPGNQSEYESLQR